MTVWYILIPAERYTVGEASRISQVESGIARNELKNKACIERMDMVRYIPLSKRIVL
ncbi:MAG: hypothetical protein ACE3L7_03165 [Candidatus Pristimantibacillus sp.]